MKNLYLTHQTNFTVENRPEFFATTFLKAVALLSGYNLSGNNRLHSARLCVDGDESTKLVKFFVTYPDFMPAVIEVAPTISNSVGKTILDLVRSFPGLTIRDLTRPDTVQPQEGEANYEHRSNYTGVVEFRITDADNGTLSTFDMGRQVAMQHMGVDKVALVHAEVDNANQSVKFVWIARGERKS